MTDNATITQFDAAGKPTGISINVADLTGANFDAQVIAVTALGDAIGAISLTGQVSKTISQNVKEGGPGDRGGVRGTKALIRWFSPLEAGTGQYGSNEIGAVDPAAFTVVGTKQMLQGTAYTNLKAAFDAVALTENGNAVEVYEVELVSRTL